MNYSFQGHNGLCGYLPFYIFSESNSLFYFLKTWKLLVYVEEHKKYDAKTFLSFLKNILKQYPKGKIVIRLDNAKIHHAKLIQPFLKENSERLELVFLPPYSPKLNRIEKLWKWLKDSVINNVFFHSVSELNHYRLKAVGSISG